MKDNRIFAILVIIAVGIWLNLLVTAFPPADVMAYGNVTDVNIVGIGDRGLPKDDNLMSYPALPVIVYDENFLGLRTPSP